MKIKIFLLLLVISSYTFAQTWYQVGATQFTDDASSAAITFDNSGTPYIVYTKVNASNKAYVKTFNGTSWVDIITPEVSTAAAYNVAMKFDPSTNYLYVAFRNTNYNMNCYQFDGTSWTSVFTDVNPGSAFDDAKIQIQFNGTSTIRVAGRGQDNKLTIIERNISGTGGSNLIEDLYDNPNYRPTVYHYDFTSFSKYYLSFDDSFNYGSVSREVVGSAISTHDYAGPNLFGALKDVSGIADENYLAVLNLHYDNIANIITKKVEVYKGGINILNGTYSKNILKFRKNTLDDQLYLMYAHQNGYLAVKIYNKATSSWSNLNPFITNTTTSNFIADMEINPIDNGLYVYYLDGGKISVKKHVVSLCNPTNIQANNITSNAANISWDAPIVNTTNWEITLVEQGLPMSNGTIFSSNTNSFALTGLLPDVSYDVYVRALCSGSFSDWYFVNFYTQKAPIYVDLNASGNNDGTSWTDAYTDLESTLSNITSESNQIWIAKGIYTPTNTIDRTISFNVNYSNTTIYGGFAGTEVDLSDRDMSLIHTTNETILDGDLAGDDDTNITFNNLTRDDNSLRILRINGDFIIIDGVTISNGYANETAGEGRYGAGLETSDYVADFTIKNCIIKNNVGRWGAGLMFSPNHTGTYVIESCIFDTNLANYGAGFYILPRANNTTNFNLSNSLFKNNETKDDITNGSGGSAGMIRANYTNTIVNSNIINNTFVFNHSQGTATSDFPTLALSKNSGDLDTSTANNIFWGNTKGTSSNTTKAFGYALNNFGTTNLTVRNSIDEDDFSNITSGKVNTSNADPLFVNSVNNDYTLQSSSPAVNTGDNSKILAGITSDLVTNNRIFNTTVDMGCYEFGSYALAVNHFEKELIYNIYPNPTKNTLNIDLSVPLQKAVIFNILGVKLLESNKTKINVANLATGAYFIKITTENGESLTKRFLKK